MQIKNTKKGNDYKFFIKKFISSLEVSEEQNVDYHIEDISNDQKRFF